MKWIGLTGGLGSGKSIVASLIKSRGHEVIDADELAKSAITKGSEAYHKVIEKFGSKLLDDDSNIRRKELGRIVFSDPLKLSLLESIVHPVVKKLALNRRQQLASKGAKVCFYDVPLLFEKKLQDEFDHIVFVYSPESLMIQRVIERDSLSRDRVQQIISSQIPIEEKLHLAEYVVRNTGSLKELEIEVEKMLEALKVPSNTG